MATTPASDDLDLDKLKVKTACCPICKGWVFLSAFPQCETSKDSQKEFRACIKAGLEIDVVTLRECHALAHCPTQGECLTKAARPFEYLSFGEPLPPVTPCPSGRNDCPSGCPKCPIESAAPTPSL